MTKEDHQRVTSLQLAVIRAFLDIREDHLLDIVNIITTGSAGKNKEKEKKENAEQESSGTAGAEGA